MRIKGMAGLNGELMMLIGIGVIIVAVVIAARMGKKSNTERSDSKKDT